MGGDGPEAGSSGETRQRGWYGVWLPRVVIGTIAVAAIWFGTIWVFTSTSHFLVTLLISVFLAAALLPGVEALVKRGWRRGLATGAVMLVGLAVVLTFVIAMTTVIIGQIVNFVERLPEYADTVTTWLNDAFGLEIDVDRFVDEVTQDEARLRRLADTALSGVLGLASTILGAIFQALTVGLFVFYMLADLPKIRASVQRRFPPRSQVHIETIFTITVDKVGGWVYSRGILAVFSGIFHLGVFMVIDLPYAVALALWVGVVSQFVPTIGTYLAGTFPLIIALLENPIDALWVVIAIAAYQQVENYLISPRVTANTMELHPAVAFGSAIVGASLLGGIGALLALPVAATITALIQTYADHYDIVQSDVEGPEAYAERMRARAREKGTRRAVRRQGVRRMMSGRQPPDGEATGPG